MHQVTLRNFNKVNLFDIFINAICVALEGRIPGWFNQKALAGQFLFSIWLISAFTLNLAFNSNLRAVLLRPKTEQPIENFQDAVDRGQHIWIGHILPDPSKPDEIDQFFLNYRVMPSIKDHIIKNKMETYVHDGMLPISNNVWKDVHGNGAVVLLPQYNAPEIQLLYDEGMFLRRGETSVAHHLMHQ